MTVSFEDLHDLNSFGASRPPLHVVSRPAPARRSVVVARTRAAEAFEEANPGLIEGLRKLATWHDFAASLVAQFHRRGSLSERQVASGLQAVARAEAKATERASARREMSGSVDVSAVEALFAKASESGLKRLKFRTDVLTITPAAATGRHRGSLHVTHDGDYAGRITAGAFVAATGARTTTLGLLTELASDPAGVSRMYGRRTGRCCCCGRELTDATSVDMGIGPICAEKWGL